MQIMHEQINIVGQNSIKVKWDDFPHFTFPLHYHREQEIVYVIESYGTRYVGDNIAKFESGDLVLLGSNLPHYWKNHHDFYKGDPNLRVKAVVIQFPDNIIGFEKNNLPEFKNIRDLFKRANRGIQFLSREKIAIGKMLKKLLNLNSLDRYIELLKILEIMATCSSYKLLSSPATDSAIPLKTDNRIEKIMHYIVNNITEEIKLEELTRLIGMNKTALCRYFKAGTGKTIVEYIHEMRIGFACKLLMEQNKTILEIAYECGFNNISNFHRIFKRITNYTPAGYLTEMSGPVN